MADMAQLEAQIRALEARRAAGESVPQLDALYAKMDAMTNKGYKAATEPASPTPPTSAPTVKKAKGGSVSSASKRADGCAQRGKTKGRML